MGLMKPFIFFLILVSTSVAQAQYCSSFFESQSFSQNQKYKYYDPENPDALIELLKSGLAKKIKNANPYATPIQEFKDNAQYLINQLSALITDIDQTPWRKDVSKKEISDLKDIAQALKLEAQSKIANEQTTYAWVWIFSLRAQMVFNIVREYNYALTDGSKYSGDFRMEYKDASGKVIAIYSSAYLSFAKNDKILLPLIENIKSINELAKAPLNARSFHGLIATIFKHTNVNDLFNDSLFWNFFIRPSSTASFYVRNLQIPVYTAVDELQLLSIEGTGTLLVGVPLDRLFADSTFYTDYTDATAHDLIHNHLSIQNFKNIKMKLWIRFNTAVLQEIEQIADQQTRTKILDAYFNITRESGDRDILLDRHLKYKKPLYSKNSSLASNGFSYLQLSSNSQKKIERFNKKERQVWIDIFDRIDRKLKP